MQRATADPSSISHDDILQLQRTIGNKATRALLTGGTLGVQKKMSPAVIQRRGWGGRAFDRMFGVDDYRRRHPQYQGSVPTKTRLSIRGEQTAKKFNGMYEQRYLEKAEVQAYYRRVGAQAQNVVMPGMNAKAIPIIDVLNSPMAFKILKDYMDSEYVSEAGFFLEQILRKGNLSGEGKPDFSYTIKETIQMYNDYIKDPSPWQNNISFKTRNKLVREMDNLESKRGFTGFRKVNSNVQDGMNDCVKEVVQVVRKDVYARLVKTEWYPYIELAAKADRRRRDFNEANRVSNREFWLGF